MRLAAFLLLGLFSVSAAAEPPQWQVDKAASSLTFTYTHDGKEKQGAFSRFDADIVFDPADPSSARIKVVVDLASVAAGSKDADEALASPDWFYVKNFPQAVFESTGVAVSQGEGYVMDASLTIRGENKKVLLPFTLQHVNNQAEAKGSLTLDRRDFALGGGFWNNPKFIGYTVQVHIDIVASH